MKIFLQFLLFSTVCLYSCAEATNSSDNPPKAENLATTSTQETGLSKQGRALATPHVLTISEVSEMSSEQRQVKMKELEARMAKLEALGLYKLTDNQLDQLLAIQGQLLELQSAATEEAVKRADEAKKRADEEEEFGKRIGAK